MAGRPIVLVTGGAGYIGSHATWALLDEGYRVVVVDDLSTGFRASVPDAAVFIEADAGDQAAVGAILATYDVAAVMHFAASTVVPQSILDPLAYYAANTVTSHALLAAAAAHGVRHFIFSSSAAVYGATADVPVGEDTPPVPINPYGRSKLMTEMMLADAAAAHGMATCALRYFNVAGADPAERTGQSGAGATHLIKAALEAATGRRPHVDIYGTDFDTPDGTGVRDYIHVTDLAAAHVAALDLLRQRPAGHVTLNCGYGRGFSVLEVLDAVDRLSGQRTRRRICGRRPGDPASVVADNRAIFAATDWRPRYDNLETIINHALQWERHLMARAAVPPRSTGAMLQ